MQEVKRKGQLQKHSGEHDGQGQEHIDEQDDGHGLRVQERKT